GLEAHLVFGKGPGRTTMRLWDLPTRLFAWLLVVAVTGSVVTIKSGMPDWHERFGLLVIGLPSFRVVWGFAGSTYARFGAFVRGPGAVRAYLRGQWQGVGHNPLGASSYAGFCLGIKSL